MHLPTTVTGATHVSKVHARVTEHENDPLPGAGVPRRSRAGSTIVLALGFGIVLLIMISALRHYSSNRIASSIREWNNLKALSLAEAGLAMVVAEMSQNFNYATHEVTKDLTWGNERTVTTPMIDFNGVDLSGGANFSGSIPGFDGSFEVRCGEIPFEDDPDTANIDESKAYVYAESIGNFKTTYRKISAVLHRRFPAKECLMYDGDVLSVVFGTTSSDKTNTFSKGALYGHRGIEISQILRKACGGNYNGTRQALDIPRLMSGRGGVFFLSPTVFNGKTIPASPDWANPDFSGSNFHYLDSAGQQTTHNKGLYPQEFLNAAPPIPAEAREWTRDKNNPVVMTPAVLPKKYYLHLANNQETTHDTTSHSTYTGGSKSMSVLDWGDAVRDGNNPPDAKVLYVKGDVAIRGNPPNDVTIVAEGDVYVDGDFNQARDASRKEHRFGYPQDYTGKDPFDVTTTDYTGLDPQTYKNTYKNARVIAGGRLVFDYSNPKTTFGNELYPFIQYKLAECLLDDETKARREFLACSGNRRIEREMTASFTYTTSSSGSDENAKKDEALEQARARLLEKTRQYLASDSKLPWDGLKPKLEEKITVGSEQTVSSVSETDENGNTVSTTVTKEVTVKFEADDEWVSGFSKEELWKKMEAENLTKTMDDLVAACDGKTDEKDDYLFFPELTTVGMFHSFAKRNPHDTFFPGADYEKHYDEMGSFAPEGKFIHRLYGSLTSFRTADALEGTGGQSYNPPIRKRIYDVTLYDKWDGNDIVDVPTFGLMTWKESRAEGFTF